MLDIDSKHDRTADCLEPVPSPDRPMFIEPARSYSPGRDLTMKTQYERVIGVDIASNKIDAAMIRKVQGVDDGRETQSRLLPVPVSLVNITSVHAKSICWFVIIINFLRAISSRSPGQIASHPPKSKGAESLRDFRY